MLNKLKERLEVLRNKTEELAAEVFLEYKVPDHIQQERYSVCQSCEHLYRPTDTCKKCGCFMQVKTWMPNQSCPIKKWGKYSEE